MTIIYSHVNILDSTSHDITNDKSELTNLLKTY